MSRDESSLIAPGDLVKVSNAFVFSGPLAEDRFTILGKMINIDLDDVFIVVSVISRCSASWLLSPRGTMVMIWNSFILERAFDDILTSRGHQKRT